MLLLYHPIHSLQTWCNILTRQLFFRAPCVESAAKLCCRGSGQKKRRKSEPSSWCRVVRYSLALFQKDILTSRAGWAQLLTELLSVGLSSLSVSPPTCNKSLSLFLPFFSSREDLWPECGSKQEREREGIIQGELGMCTERECYML